MDRFLNILLPMCLHEDYCYYYTWTAGATCWWPMNGAAHSPGRLLSANAVKTGISLPALDCLIRYLLVHLGCINGEHRIYYDNDGLDGEREREKGGVLGIIIIPFFVQLSSISNV